MQHHHKNAQHMAFLLATADLAMADKEHCSHLLMHGDGSLVFSLTIPTLKVVLFGFALV